LNNIAWTISSIDFSTGHLNSLKKFWSTLSQTIWDEIISPVLASNTADIELASSITSLAWAVSRSGTVNIGAGEQRKFMALYQASMSLPKVDDEDAFQSLGVKSIGVLGRLALDPAPIELNREVGVFLLTVLAAADAPVADVVEALNQIFDIYADKAYPFDEVCLQDLLIHRLSLHPPRSIVFFRSKHLENGMLTKFHRLYFGQTTFTSTWRKYYLKRKRWRRRSI
jgi:hypothetical protein